MENEKEQVNWEKLEGILSPDRLKPYKEDAFSAKEILEKYIRNIKLSESFYPSIQNLEVSLRNSIHKVLAESLHDAYWFERDDFTQFLSQETLEKAKEKIRKQLHSKKIIPNEKLQDGQIIAELTFGTWVRFFNPYIFNQYSNRFKVKKIFPNIAKEFHSDIRKEVAKRLNPILEIRNRVFHHEPIWHWNNLESIHQDIYRVIGWIDRDLLAMTKEIDRFPEVYKQRP